MDLADPPHVESSGTRDGTLVPCSGMWIFIHCATREVPHLTSWIQLFQNQLHTLGSKFFFLCVCVCVCVCACTHSVVSDSLQSPELSSARLLCLWNFPGKNTGVGRHFLLQGIFPTKRWTPRCLRHLHYRQILDPLSRWVNTVKSSFVCGWTQVCVGFLLFEAKSSD